MRKKAQMEKLQLCLSKELFWKRLSLYTLLILKIVGILASKCLVAFISDEYAESPNCRMEIQFAMKSLNKPVIPVIVGTGDSWRQTVVGALTASTDKVQLVDCRGIESEAELSDKLTEIMSQISMFCKPDRTQVESGEQKRSRAPKVGDHVVCHHFRWVYYMATVVKFDPEQMEYTVDWDDGDPSGRVQPYDQVAIDEMPEADDIGVGSVVFFAQGHYKGSEGNNTGGVRYHEGVVTHVDRTSPEEVIVHGHHTKGEDDGKPLHRGYQYEFVDRLENVRMAATAFDTLMN